MKLPLHLVIGLGCGLVVAGCGSQPAGGRPAATRSQPGPKLVAEWNMKDKVVKTEAEWKAQLSADAFHVLREKGTERSFTGAYWNNKASGVYYCAGCGLALFDAQTKYESGTGWPSFYEPIATGNVGTESDNTLFMRRTEVHCARCGGHLGHVFKDGPKPTGLRFCINSAALKFQEAAKAKSGADTPEAQ